MTIELIFIMIDRESIMIVCGWGTQLYRLLHMVIIAVFMIGCVERAESVLKGSFE